MALNIAAKIGSWAKKLMFEKTGLESYLGGNPSRYQLLERIPEGAITPLPQGHGELRPKWQDAAINRCTR
jgi:hypothetical protein